MILKISSSSHMYASEKRIHLIFDVCSPREGAAALVTVARGPSVLLVGRDDDSFSCLDAQRQIEAD